MLRRDQYVRRRAPGRETSDRRPTSDHGGVGVPVVTVPAVAQSLLPCGAEVMRRSAWTRCDVPGVQWGMPNKLRRHRCVPATRPHRRQGWRVDGGPAFLMAFETDEACTRFVLVTATKRYGEVVPSDYAGEDGNGSRNGATASGSVGGERNVWPTCCARSGLVGTKRGVEVAASATSAEPSMLREANGTPAGLPPRRGASDFARRGTATYPSPWSHVGCGQLEASRLAPCTVMCCFLDDPAQPTNNRLTRALRGAVIAAEGRHRRRWSAGNQPWLAMATALVIPCAPCVQPCSGLPPSEPLHRSAPLINGTESATTGEIACAGAIDLKDVASEVIDHLEGGVKPYRLRGKKYNV